MSSEQAETKYEKAEDVVRTGSFAGHILGLNP